MLVNSLTEKWISAYTNRPKTSLLIDSNNDIVSAVEIIEKIHSDLVKTNSPLVIIQPEDKATIGINDIRQMQRSLSVKADATGEITRIAAVKEAEKLTVEAQNALLKLMEELPERTVLALLSTDPSKLLETIKSRCFTIPVLPITEEDAFRYADANGVSNDTAKQAYLMSDGMPGAFKSYIKDIDSISKGIDQAKEFLSSTVFQRQKLIKKISENKTSAIVFIDNLQSVTKSAMRAAPSSKAKISWKNRLKAIQTCREQINRNVPAKLSLLSLSVSL